MLDESIRLKLHFRAYDQRFVRVYVCAKGDVTHASTLNAPPTQAREIYYDGGDDNNDDDNNDHLVAAAVTQIKTTHKRRTWMSCAFRQSNHTPHSYTHTR